MAIENLNPEGVDAFRKDFSEMIRIAVGLGKYYSKADKDFDLYMPKYKSLIKLFNKKYANLNLDTAIEKQNLMLEFFIKENDLKSVFTEAASKLKGLVSIGTGGFNEVSVSESEQISEIMKHPLNKLFLSYFDQTKGAGSFLIVLDKKKGMVKIVCSYKEIITGPAFGLCAFYALKSFDSNIAIYEEGVKFGFVDELTDQERRDWDKRFVPYFGE